MHKLWIGVCCAVCVVSCRGEPFVTTANSTLSPPNSSSPSAAGGATSSTPGGEDGGEPSNAASPTEAGFGGSPVEDSSTLEDSGGVGPTTLDASASAGMDSGPPEELSLVVSDKEVVVRRATVFELVFAKEVAWQPKRWLDLAFSSTENLATPSEAPLKEAAFVAQVGVLFDDNWSTLNEARDAELEATQPTPEQVVVKTAWTWSRSNCFEARVDSDYRVSAAGVIAVSVKVTPNQSIRVASIEYGWTNLNADVPWTTMLSGDGQSYHIARQIDLESKPWLEVKALMPRPGIHIASDHPGGRYLAEPVEATFDSDNPW